MITINRTSLFNRDWYEESILFVNDLLDYNGNLLDYMAFIDKYNLNCTCGEFCKICKVIPLSPIQVIQNTLMDSNVESVLPNPVINDFSLKDSKCYNK